MKQQQMTKEGVRNLSDPRHNGKIPQDRCKHLDSVHRGHRQRLCLSCGLVYAAAVLLLLLASRAAEAQRLQQPEICLVTQFAHLDKKTGKVEKMAGEKFFCTGKKTSHKAFGIAHRSWPCGTMVLLVNVRNGRSVKAPVIDRGPYWAVPRRCSRDALGQFASHACWKRGKTIVKRRLISRKWVHGNCGDVTPPVARALRLRGKEPVIIYRLPRRRYNW